MWTDIQIKISWVPGQMDVNWATTVQEGVSAFVGLNQLDIFNETSGQFSAKKKKKTGIHNKMWGQFPAENLGILSRTF